jgi:HSP20 family molecular chaperone IbpA
VVESADRLDVHIALPGVSAESITIVLEPDAVVVSALRPFPCRETGSHIHRLEIPYGRFERRLALPPQAPIELAAKQLADGVLTLSFRRKEGA